MSSKIIAVGDCEWLHLPMNGRWPFSILVILIFLAFSHGALASAVTVGWEPVSDSRVSGYEIGYGTASGQYQWTKAANSSGMSTSSQVVDGLQPDTRYYFAVRSVCATSGEASAYSAEKSATTPAEGIAVDTSAPTVSITSPASGTTYSETGTVRIQTDPHDNVGVTKVELYDGSTLKATLTSGSSYDWVVDGGSNGTHRWTAKAYDAAGNSGTSAAVSLTVDIQTQTAMSCSGTTLWPESARPANGIEDADRDAVELGVKFRSDTDGYICGIRFYKGGTRNGGTHVGRLWASDGELLAKATFRDETSSGWQQVDFASPVAIQADTLYVASYNAPKGGYAWDSGYFSRQGVDSATLHALRSDASGGNGVYGYGDGRFPNATWYDTNYWVDVVFTTNPGNGAPDGQVEGMVPGVLDVGEVSVGDDWTWVEFQQDFADPIVIATPPSSSGSEPAVVRVDTSEADAGGFWIRLQQWDYVPNPGQAQERVSYMVVERGHQVLPDGTWIEAGSLETNRVNGFQRVDFDEAFAEAPVVLTSVTSVNGREAVTTRLRNVDGSGFEVGMEEQEGNAPSHAAERIDYVAWEHSWGDIAGMHYEAGLVPDTVSDSHYTFVYPTAFEETPFFLAGMQTTNGEDTAALRRENLASDAVDLWVEEEQSKDTETRHFGESVGYILIAPTQP